MSNYLDNVVSRSLNAVEVIQPRVPLLFEPSAPLTRMLPQIGEPREYQFDQEAHAVKAETIQARTAALPANSWPQPTQLLELDSADRSNTTSRSQLGQEDPPASLVSTQEERLPQPDPLVAPRVVKLRHSLEDAESLLLPGENEKSFPLAEPDLRTIGSCRPTIEYWHNQDDSQPASDTDNLMAKPAQVPAHAREVKLVERVPGALLDNGFERRESPNIKITIGRVDVRAIMPQTPPQKPAPVRPKPSVSLNEYLKQREEGKR
jgi:hypothetical protein